MSAAEGAASAAPSTEHLFPVGERLPLRRYLAEAWKRRDLAIVIPRERFWSSTSETALGSLWHFLTPVLQVVVFWVIFGILLDADRGVPNTLSFIATGVFTFTFSQQTIMKGTKSITANRALIHSILLPADPVAGSGVGRPVHRTLAIVGGDGGVRRSPPTSVAAVVTTSPTCNGLPTR